jgi:outer membrane immunogenic protein
MKSQGFLLATAAGAAFVPGAQAADLPTKAPAYVDPPASWAGFYIGLHAGANWQQAHTHNFYADSATTTSTGFIGGGQIGYNWQRGNFVLGLEADGSWLSGKGSNATPQLGIGGGYVIGATNKIEWLSTVRSRFGLAVGDTMVYTTAGVAFGGVKNSLGLDAGPNGTKSESKTRVGWAVGGGVEHMWNRNWTIALEGLFVDLGKSSVNASPVLGGARFKTTRFSNQAVIGRVKLNYKF